METKEIAQQLKELAALPEDPGSILIADVIVNSCNFSSKGSDFLPFACNACM